MLSDLGVLLFQALGGGMLPFFWTLELEAVEKGEMLHVFQILSFEAVDKGGNAVRFSNSVLGKASGRGECCPFFFLPIFRALGGLKRGFRRLWKTLGSHKHCFK